MTEGEENRMRRITATAALVMAPFRMAVTGALLAASTLAASATVPAGTAPAAVTMAAGMPAGAATHQVTYSSAFYVAYEWNNTYQVSGAGLNHAAQLVHGLGETYVVQANSAHEWKFHEAGNLGRCLQWSTAFIKTENCQRGSGAQYFDPVSYSNGYRFRVPGKTFVWSFRLPPSSGRTIYAASLGNDGYGQLWRLIFTSRKGEAAFREMTGG